MQIARQTRQQEPFWHPIDLIDETATITGGIQLPGPRSSAQVSPQYATVLIVIGPSTIMITLLIHTASGRSSSAARPVFSPRSQHGLRPHARFARASSPARGSARVPRSCRRRSRPLADASVADHAAELQD